MSGTHPAYERLKSCYKHPKYNLDNFHQEDQDYYVQQEVIHEHKLPFVVSPKIIEAETSKDCIFFDNFYATSDIIVPLFLNGKNTSSIQKDIGTFNMYFGNNVIWSVDVHQFPVKLPNIPIPHFCLSFSPLKFELKLNSGQSVERIRLISKSIILNSELQNLSHVHFTDNELHIRYGAGLGLPTWTFYENEQKKQLCS